ncbi:ABC transporter ATP-binding protein [Perlabentimonas gracilis]|uniref:ABC transporter ATP-binding protein n=1 Tax=Perlabentimonas gracilis TaxID=2715279 RepID=UPI00140CBDFB|nr:ABC transporter ATP-binding protein [Perlabentimonas gracilis]NHB68398.1 ABC transporter ATP-binding protein [Perlabentimonas gracilis]
MENILTVSGLSKWFGSTKAIENISFEVAKGQVVGILGPNGSGKTTTLSTILGIRHPSQGTFSWFNLAAGLTANKRIGSLIEVPYFYPYLNLKQNLELVALARGNGAHDIDSVLQVVGLLTRSQSKYYTLSLGMKQRLALASALLGDPEVLVLDEPTNGLDPEGIADVRRIITEQSQRGKTIILASHILDEVEKVCSHVVILKEGNIISKGSVAELLTQKQTISIFADDMEMLTTALNSISEVEIVDKKPDSITVSLSETIKPAQVNARLVSMGVPPSGIMEHKTTLETQFLELIRKEHED